MLTVRKSAERGHADHGWLDSYHSFSFADYFDPEHMGYGNLRVINEDFIAPGRGFGMHGHRDMEIVTYILHGALAHRDSMGNGATIRPGEVQRMSAGRGVLHSEVNEALKDRTHLLQIWILPDEQGIKPSYEQKFFDAADKRGRLRVVAAPDGRDGAVTLHADAAIYSGLLDGDERAVLPLNTKRLTYVHVARGALNVNGVPLSAGDAAMLETESHLELNNGHDAEVLVFDLAP